MNLCITQPIEKYGTLLHGAQVGPYYRYRDRPALLAIILLTTTVPYFWEEGSPVDMMMRPDKVKERQEHLLSESLKHLVGGSILAYWIHELNPYQLMLFLEGFDLSDLPLCQEFTPEQVRYTVKARAAAWLSSSYGAGIRLTMPAKDVVLMTSLDRAIRKEVFGDSKAKVPVH